MRMTQIEEIVDRVDHALDRLMAIAFWLTIGLAVALVGSIVLFDVLFGRPH